MWAAITSSEKAYLSEKDFKMADTEKLRSGWKHYVEKQRKNRDFMEQST